MCKGPGAWTSRACVGPRSSAGAEWGGGWGGSSPSIRSRLRRRGPSTPAACISMTSDQVGWGPLTAHGEAPSETGARTGNLPEAWVGGGDSPGQVPVGAGAALQGRVDEQLVEDISLQATGGRSGSRDAGPGAGPPPTPLRAARSQGRSGWGTKTRTPHPAGTAPRGDGARAPQQPAWLGVGGSPGRCCLRSGPRGSGWAGEAPPRGRGARSQPPPGPGTGAAPRRGPGGADSSPRGTCRPRKGLRAGASGARPPPACPAGVPGPAPNTRQGH